MWVDPIETYELPVVAPSDVKLDGPATFEPKTIKVRVPRQAFEKAKALGNLAAIAQIPATGDLATPGTHLGCEAPG